MVWYYDLISKSQIPYFFQERRCAEAASGTERPEDQFEGGEMVLHGTEERSGQAQCGAHRERGEGSLKSFEIGIKNNDKLEKSIPIFGYRLKLVKK